MRKLILALFIVLVLAFSVQAKDYTATFQWEQDVMVAGDSWRISSSLVSGGPYTELFTVPYVTDQTTYEYSDTISVTQKTFFVVYKVRADGVISDPSNEIFFEPVNAPFNLKIIIQTP